MKTKHKYNRVTMKILVVEKKKFEYKSPFKILQKKFSKK